jgi:hypothetical protein
MVRGSSETLVNGIAVELNKPIIFSLGPTLRGRWILWGMPGWQTCTEREKNDEG